MAGLLAAALLSGCTSAPAVRNAPRRLGTLGGDQSEATAINNRGQVVGQSTTAVAGQSHAFIWQAGRLTDLGTLGGSQSRAVDINEAGQVVGTSTTAGGAYHAFIWQDDAMTDLGTLPEQQGSEALAINDRGQVVGDSGTRAFLWRQGKMIDLGVLPGGDESEVRAINDRGQVVGVGSTHDSEERAFLWQGGRIGEIGALGSNDRESHAVGINDRSQVIGDSDGRTIVWTDASSSSLTGLGGACCELAGINAGGQVAGTSGSGSGRTHAFLWTRGAITDLGRSAGHLSTVAVAIDDAGDVVGYATAAADEMTGARPFYWHDGRLIMLSTLPGSIRTTPTALNGHGQAVGHCFLGPEREEAVLWQSTE